MIAIIGRETIAQQADAKNAARYQWLRDHAGEVHGPYLSWEAESEKYGDEADAESLDLAIDAAMASEKKNSA